MQGCWSVCRGAWLWRSGCARRGGGEGNGLPGVGLAVGPGASHLCGPCLPGCSGPAAAGPGCKASPRPSSRRAAVVSAPTWCRMPAGQAKGHGAGSQRPGCSAAASGRLVARAARRMAEEANQRAVCWEAPGADADWAGGSALAVGCVGPWFSRRFSLPSGRQGEGLAQRIRATPSTPPRLGAS